MIHLTIEQLFSSDYGLQDPFAIDMGEGLSLEVETVLRYLPGKRLACQARWKGEKVFAKLFYRKLSSENYQRELHGAALIKEKNIRAARLLETYTNKQCHIIFYELLHGSLFSLAGEDNKEQRLADLKKVFEFVAELHNADLIHNDLHINNLFLVKDALYLLDTGSVNREVGENRKIENFASLIAQFPLCDHAALVIQKNFYERTRGINLLKQDLEKNVRDCWQHRKKQFLKKIMRNCTEVSMIEDKNRYVLVKRNLLTPALKAVLDKPDEAMDRGVFLKDGNSQTVTRVFVDHAPLVIKRYNQKTFLNAIKRRLGINRARNCWRYAHLLAMVGIKTPLPVAVIEETKGSVYYISRHADGQKLSYYYREKKNIDALVDSLKALFNSLHLARVAHGDLKASNILVEGKKLCVIDLDAMTEDALNYSYRRKKDMDRFFANFESTDTFIKIKNQLQLEI